MRYLIASLLPVFLCALSSQAAAQFDIAATCPGGVVIELDGQIVCEKEDTLSLLIADFEMSELTGDIYRLGQEGNREALKQLPNLSFDSMQAGNAITTGFIARHAALSPNRF